MGKAGERVKLYPMCMETAPAPGGTYWVCLEPRGHEGKHQSLNGRAEWRTDRPAKVVKVSRLEAAAARGLRRLGNIVERGLLK